VKKQSVRVLMDEIQKSIPDTLTKCEKAKCPRVIQK
jgi:hypothetical protein